MERTHIIDTPAQSGKEVLINGWIASIRDHGGVSFFDIKDATATIQVVVLKDLRESLGSVSEWSTVSITGLIKDRPEKLQNKDLPTGTIEMEAKGIEVLGVSKPLPFPLDTQGHEISEDLRLKYRYLDLRRDRLQTNMRLRQQVQGVIRSFLSEKNFFEIETPLLTKTTPEGARDFVVPSRMQPGHFYALPQSPQQYKQLMMVAGFERYFQLARCMRDEDLRSDRLLEFTQLDLEMSFVTEEDVMQINEALLIEIVETLFPEKTIQEKPFPRISFKEAMEKYGTDRPDLRKDKDDPNLLAFCWIVDWPFFEKTDKGDWTFTHNPFSEPQAESKADLLAGKNIENIMVAQYDIALNGSEIAGGSIRAHEAETLQAVLKVMGLDADKAKEDFGHMFEAFEYGAPPHGGIAWGFDRLLAILTNEPSIREVIALPTTGSGSTSIMEAPSEISAEQLKELHLSIVKNDAEKKNKEK